MGVGIDESGGHSQAFAVDNPRSPAEELEVVVTADPDYGTGTDRYQLGPRMTRIECQYVGIVENEGCWRQTQCLPVTNRHQTIITRPAQTSAR